MRTRSLAAVVLLLASSSTLFMTGCSGKPENSPGIRKKFAEYDKSQKSVEEMSVTVASLSEEVKRLSNENSELRALMPEVDGQNAVSKLTTMEERLTKLEGGAIPVQTASVAPVATTDQAAAPVPAPVAAEGSKALEDQPLAGSVQQAATEKAAPVTAPEKQDAPAAPKEVKQAKETKKSASSEKKMVASSFKDKTATSKPAVIKTSSSAKGKYHEIAAGETADSIAAKYNISRDELMKMNGMPAGAKLAKGQRLFVPAPR
ncbi:LysM peptidoglycan-binding domain-containing protein [Candidatus Sumerlaeota bacterium]|nr:LysM peptidoglycan-binding domain-containing protein [Candidatus Sumerlaeota bacterium]